MVGYARVIRLDVVIHDIGTETKVSLLLVSIRYKQKADESHQDGEDQETPQHQRALCKSTCVKKATREKRQVTVCFVVLAARQEQMSNTDPRGRKKKGNERVTKNHENRKKVVAHAIHRWS